MKKERQPGANRSGRKKTAQNTVSLRGSVATEQGYFSQDTLLAPRPGAPNYESDLGASLCSGEDTRNV